MRVVSEAAETFSVIVKQSRWPHQESPLVSTRTGESTAGKKKKTT